MCYVTLVGGLSSSAGVCLWCPCGVFWMCEFPHTQVSAADLNGCLLRAMARGDGCSGGFVLYLSLGLVTVKLLKQSYVVTEDWELRL